MVEDRARVLAQPVGQLLVGQRLVEAEPQDAHAQRVASALASAAVGGRRTTGP